MGDALARNPDKNYVQSVADAYMNCDLNGRYIQNKAATYLPPAPDDGIDGIFIGDTLIVDRSIKPKPGAVILAEIEGQYCLRRLIRHGSQLMLADDKGYVPPRIVTNNEYYHGTVTHNIHSQSW